MDIKQFVLDALYDTNQTAHIDAILNVIDNVNFASCGSMIDNFDAAMVDDIHNALKISTRHNVPSDFDESFHHFLGVFADVRYYYFNGDIDD